MIATSALELGIDVGGLDACILVGYPGSLISSWQRIGRVGRRGEGLVVLIAMPDALDQYVVHHPELFFGGSSRRRARPRKPVRGRPAPGLRGRGGAAAPRGARGARAIGGLDVVTAADRRGPSGPGRRRHHLVLVPPPPAPRRQPALGRPAVSDRRARGTRGADGASRDRILGKIDGLRVYHECHPGAIYLHGGQSFHVRELDRGASPGRGPSRRRVDYYTVVLGEKETEILEQLERRALGQFFVGYGRLKVTVRIRGYQKRRLFGGEPLSSHQLDVPPVVYETVGFWIELPAGLPAAFTASRDLHFMGGIHAAEHAIIGLFPLLAIAERGDVGGISYTGHPQLAGTRDLHLRRGARRGRAGGAGLSRIWSRCSCARSSWSRLRVRGRVAPGASSRPSAATATSRWTRRPRVWCCAR